MNARMNALIPERWDDKVYFYAHTVERDAEGGWTILVDPAACLVRDDRFAIDEVAALPTVGELRRAGIERAVSGSALNPATRWEGRILFSAGTILFVDGRILLLQRDAAAVDPFLWTSPAGRCDRDLHLTAVKEFFEEVLLTEAGTPVFVQLPGSEEHAAAIDRIYATTCHRRGIQADVERWIRLRARAARSLASIDSPWRLVFGHGDDSEIHEGRGFMFFDEECNTLEFRLVMELDTAGHELVCIDGEEYGRPVQLFTLAQMEGLGLVTTMSRFRDLAMARRGGGPRVE